MALSFYSFRSPRLTRSTELLPGLFNHKPCTLIPPIHSTNYTSQHDMFKHLPHKFSLSHLLLFKLQTKKHRPYIYIKYKQQAPPQRKSTQFLYNLNMFLRSVPRFPISQAKSVVRLKKLPVRLNGSDYTKRLLCVF
jgi:hypothetical protein